MMIRASAHTQWVRSPRWENNAVVSVRHLLVYLHFRMLVCVLQRQALSRDLLGTQRLFVRPPHSLSLPRRRRLPMATHPSS